MEDASKTTDHWRCAQCVESVLYSFANGHVEHVRMWKCCQCGFAENRVSLWDACSMCDSTILLEDYACHYPSPKVFEVATEEAMSDNAAYSPSDVISVEAPGMGTYSGIHASDDFISMIQRNMPLLGPVFGVRQQLQDSLVPDGFDETSMLTSINDLGYTGLEADGTDQVRRSIANLPTPYEINDSVTAYSHGNLGVTATISSDESSSTASAPTKTHSTPSTLTAMTRSDLDSGYGTQSNISKADQASRKRANEADDEIPPRSDTTNNDTSPPPRKKPRRRRCNTNNPGLACPFYVRNPYSCKHDSCVGPGFLGIHRLKQHLERVHLYYTCERCGATFLGNSTGRQDLATHQRNPQPCQLMGKPSPQISSLSHATFEVMRSKKGAAGKSEEERWREIYRLIFPDAENKELKQAYVDMQCAVQGDRDQDDMSTRCEGSHNTCRELLRILPSRLNEIIASRLDDVKLTAIWREFADDQLRDLVEATLADLSSPKQVLPSSKTTLDQEKAFEETNDLSWLDLVDYTMLP